MTSMRLSDTDFDFKHKSVLVSIDCDVDLETREGKLVVDEDFRLNSAMPTLNYLKDKGVGKITLLGHIGRPSGKFVSELSLTPIAEWFSQKFGSCQLVPLENLSLEKLGYFNLIENLRFDPGEEGNNIQFSEKLAGLGDVFVNEAFGYSHRSHASIVGIPKLLPSFLGLRFEAEVKTLSWLKQKAGRPLVFVLGGSKSDKLDYIDFLAEWCDKVLIGGKLPQLVKDRPLDEKIKIGELVDNGKDINEQSINEFKEIISSARTLFWAGPMGVYEEESNQEGTYEIAKTIAQSKVFKVAGGGDTHRIISRLNLWEKFDFVSVGGGAMLDFLKDNSLPGIEALRGSNQ